MLFKRHAIGFFKCKCLEFEVAILNKTHCKGRKKKEKKKRKKYDSFLLKIWNRNFVL